jgi:hypothetical protein
MMRDLDAMIDEALGDEERDLLRRIGEEPGFFAQAFGLFGGRTGWVNIILIVVQAVAFVAGVVMAVGFFQAVDPVSQLRWGLPAAVLLLMSTMVKLAMMPALEANRVIRELKRVELQIARKGA